MRFLVAALFSISLAAIAVPASADDDATICSQYSSATDAERTAACDRILAAPDASARASSIAHVRDDVMAATNRRQQPFSYGSLSGSQDFYFVSK